MKIVNGELTATLAKLNSLKPIVLKGDVQLAIVEFKNQLKAKISTLEVAATNAAEALCSKGLDGKPITQQKDAGNGGIFISYTFPSVEAENKCKETLDEIYRTENELTVLSSSLTKEMISELSCTTEQAEALLMLIPSITMEKV